MRKALLVLVVLGAVLSTGCSDNGPLRAQVEAEQQKIVRLQAQHQERQRVQHDMARLQNRIRATQAAIDKLKKR
ncbi:MAG: hypothetical protein ACYCW6_20635 [Candidatus Xenobia bacterium]